MSFSKALLVSVFGFAVVFVGLIGLMLIVKIQTYLIGRFSVKQIPEETKSEIKVTNQKEVQETNKPEISSGELTLIGVDEKIAAMIMAIVSDESQIPLSELHFKSITAVE